MPKSNNEKTYRVVELTAQNIMRLKAITIKPDGNVVVITGKNEAGKSAALNALWIGFGGGDVTRNIDNILRSGEKEGKIHIDIGEFVIDRKFTLRDDGTMSEKIELRNKDGAVFKQPQTLLKAMMDTRTADSMAFARMKPKEQVDTLMQAIGKSEEFEALQTKRDELFADRTIVNGGVRNMEGELAGIEDPKVPDGVDADDPQEISAADILGDIEKSREKNDANQRVRDEFDTTVAVRDVVANTVNKLKEQLQAAEEEQREAMALYKKQAQIVDALPAYIDTDPLHDKLRDVEAINSTVRDIVRHREATAKLAQKKTESDDLTAKINECDAQKSEIVASADLPVKGLTIGDGQLLYNGQTLNDSADSVKLRVSVAMAMKLNPKIRVLRITDGALLDSEAMEQIHEMADEHDFQIWIERVEDKSKAAVVIEDGAVKQRTKPKAKAKAKAKATTA